MRKKYDNLQRMRGLEAYDLAFENFLRAAKLNGELQMLVSHAYELGFGAYYDEEGNLVAFARDRYVDSGTEKSIFEILSEGTKEELEYFAGILKLSEQEDYFVRQELGLENMLRVIGTILDQTKENLEPERQFELAA